MKKTFLFCIIYLLAPSIRAQDGNSVFNFLRLPNSARATALGGTNVSLIENDLSLVFQNPGFLGQEMDKNLNLGYMSYIADVGAGNVAFAKAMGTRSAWGVGVNYVDYGNVKEVLPENIIVGDLSLKDICLNAFFSRDLTEKIRGGVTAKYIYSNYAEFTAMGLAVDLGLSYYDKDHQLSIGLVGKNLGREIKAYEQIYEAIPWDIQLGLSQKLAHAPIRYSVTAMYLNKWKFYNPEGEKDNFAATLAKHFVFGLEFIPTENLWVGLGYNVKTASDMNIQYGNKMGGFSLGAGIKVKAFNVGCSVGRYHPSATSFMLSLTTSFSEMNL